MSRDNGNKLINLFKIINNLSIKDVIKKIELFVANKNSPHYILVANINHLEQMRKNKMLKKIYDDASMVLPDGKYIYWLSRLVGLPLKEYIRGIDLFYAICELAAKEDYKTMMVGGRPGAINISKIILEKKYPGLQICKTFFYPLGSIENHKDLNDQIVQDINQLNIDILFLGIGTPREQEWIYKYKYQVKCVVIGVGSVYDFISQKIKESPRFLQNTGLEWLWRLMSEPRRLWKRYLVENLSFLTAFFWHYLLLILRRI